MKINKNEIIDEIILLEPELVNDRKKLENILKDIINIKPNIEISLEFKNELKEKLLNRIKLNSYVYKNNKYNYLKFFISFIFWWITTFSLLWILWINLDFLNSNNRINTQELWIVQMWKTSEIQMQRSIMPMSSEISTTMTTDIESISDTVKSLPENTSLNTELRNYLEKLSLDDKIIEEILNIVKKYK